MDVILDKERLLIAEEVAKILRSKLSTIRKWVHEKKIPFIKFGPGKKSIVVFNPVRLNQWINEQSHEPIAEYEK